MPTKRCCHCHEVKPLSAFNRLASSSDGYRRDCKACIKDYRERTRERQAVYMRQYWRDNGVALRAQKREHYYASDTHIHRLPEVERFWAHVDMSQAPEACWLWVGSTNPDGYGTFHRKPHVSAHRFAWEIHNGPIPPGLSILHTCDVRACVRPVHLFLGTQKDNMQDAAAKGRTRNHHTSRTQTIPLPLPNPQPLNPPQRRFIRKSSMSLEGRFWEKVDRSHGPKACWPWIGGRIGGYGVFRAHGRVERAHRVSYRLQYGEFLASLFVLHKCNNPACVNPSHLSLGTPADNSQDMLQSNRHSRLFSPEEVRLIRSLEGTISARLLAARYGVKSLTIRNIWLKCTHKHV